MKHRGFSLIELIVGIVIVAVLLGLLLSVFPKVIDKGHAAACASNLRNISQMFHARLGDKGGFFPWYDKRLYGYDGLWWHQLYWYSGLEDADFSALFTCPSDEEPRRVNMPAGRYAVLGYRYNKRLGYNDGSSWIYPQRHLTSHPFPERVPIIADGSSPIKDNAPAFDEWHHVYQRHGSKPRFGNVLFLDGHIEQIHEPAPDETVPTHYDLKARLFN